MNSKFTEVPIKCILSFLWAFAVCVFVIIDTASIELVCLTAVAEAVIVLFQNNKHHLHCKERRHNFILLLILSLVVQVTSFLGLVGIDSYKDTMIISKDIFYSWMNYNAFQALELSGILLIYLLHPGLQMNRKNKLLTSIISIVLILSALATLYARIYRDNLMSDWMTWLDYAWFAQMLYFLCVPAFFVTILIKLMCQKDTPLI